jgi:2,4-dienoyl-CoA reductase-like NADH-dependent reductase (Old Yellow Enzyme family)
MAQLFDPIRIRDVTFKNRVGVSPMCQYSAGVDGRATDWHFAHLGARAIGGAGVVIVEATAVEPRGRISPADLGLWEDSQIEPLARIAEFVEGQGAVSGIQIAHAGRKASTPPPWTGRRSLADHEGGWNVVGPTEAPFSEGSRTPHALTKRELGELRTAFRETALRARTAGFRLLELHGAHGYLLHSFLSPLSNTRSDEYGGTFDGRARLLLEVVRDLREVWPLDRVLAVRLSCSDWVEGGWTSEDTVELAAQLTREGVDLIDCSSGGSTLKAAIPVEPGYQVHFSEAIKRTTSIHTAAVGLITEPAQADQIIAAGRADFVLLARELLRNPHWPLAAARALGQQTSVPNQYARAF